MAGNHGREPEPTQRHGYRRTEGQEPLSQDRQVGGVVQSQLYTKFGGLEIFAQKSS